MGSFYCPHGRKVKLLQNDIFLRMHASKNCYDILQNKLVTMNLKGFESNQNRMLVKIEFVIVNHFTM